MINQAIYDVLSMSGSYFFSPTSFAQPRSSRAGPPAQLAPRAPLAWLSWDDNWHPSPRFTAADFSIPPKSPQKKTRTFFGCFNSYFFGNQTLRILPGIKDPARSSLFDALIMFPLPFSIPGGFRIEQSRVALRAVRTILFGLLHILAGVAQGPVGTQNQHDKTRGKWENNVDAFPPKTSPVESC